jgi:hypothetical protein
LENWITSHVHAVEYFGGVPAVWVPDRYVGPLMHDRIIGAIELCCRRGEMLLIQNKRIDWDTHTIGIPGHTTKDKENCRIPFDPEGRMAAILRRRISLGPNAFVFGTESGELERHG